MGESIALNTVLFEIGVALFAGAFIGLQREMRHNAVSSSHAFLGMGSSKMTHGFLGIRSCIFLAILGALSTMFESISYLPVVFFIVIALFFGISHAAGSFTLGKYGMTSELIGLTIFWIGVLVGSGFSALAIILTVLVTGVNTFRDHIDNFIGALSHKEWLAALQLFAFSGAVLPILPNMPVTEMLASTSFALSPIKEGDPLTFSGLLYAVLSDINLFKVWIFVLFISSISFVGYFLSKFIGAKGGIPIAAFLGALSSSTAVTLSLASQEKDSYKTSGSQLASLIFVAGLLIGIATMMLRVILGVFVIGGLSMGTGIFLIPLSMSLVSGIMAVYYLTKYNRESKKHGSGHADIKLSSPFEILPAIQFAGFYVMISVLMNISLYYQDWIESKVSFISEHLPLYVISFISGFADVDAVYINVSDLVTGGNLIPSAGVITITIAVIMNTVVKIFYIKLGASKHMGNLMAVLITGICIVGALVTALVIM